MKVLFIYNPQAGHIQIKYNLWDIVNVLSSKYKDLNIYASKKRKDVTNFIKNNGSNYELIVVSGGDGTLSEAINGLMKLNNKPTLGYIPAGTTNDYATSLKIPSDMKKAANLIISSKATPVDIGKFNSNYFVYVAAFGAFTDVAYSTPQDYKKTLGHLAYVLSGINSISKIKSYKLHVSVDDKSYDGNYLYGMVTNTLSVGGVYHLDNKKKVKLDDGLFEVMLIQKPNDLIELSEITAHLLDQKIKTNLVQTFVTNKITFTSKKKLPWTLDGEYGGSPNKVTIECLNKAIQIKK